MLVGKGMWIVSLLSLF